MLRSVKEAMASPEPATALRTVAAKATALRTRAESLDVLHAADQAARRYAHAAISRLN